MTFPAYKEIDSLVDIVEIEKEILLLQKSLFNLRLKFRTRKEVKPHLFVHAKRRIAQLNLKKSIVLKSKK